MRVGLALFPSRRAFAWNHANSTLECGHAAMALLHGGAKGHRVCPLPGCSAQRKGEAIFSKRSEGRGWVSLAVACYVCPVVGTHRHTGCLSTHSFTLSGVLKPGQGLQDMRIVWRIGQDGAAMDSPDQNVFGVPSEVDLENGDTVSFNVQKTVEYSGKLVHGEKGKPRRIVGQLTQFGQVGVCDKEKTTHPRGARTQLVASVSLILFDHSHTSVCVVV